MKPRLRWAWTLPLLLILTACPNDLLPPDSFSLKSLPGSLELETGERGGVTIELHRADFFSGYPVTLSVPVVPEGLEAEIQPNPVVGNSSTLVIRGASSGNYELSVIATSRNLEEHLRVPVTVAPRQAEGTASISGRLSTINADIPIRTAATATTTAASLSQVPEAPEYVPGQLLVRYRNPSGDELAPLSLGVYELTSQAVEEAFELVPLQAGDPNVADLVMIPEGEDVLALAARLSADPRVLYAEPNYVLHTLNLPNDPRLQEQWALAAAGVPAAWQLPGSAPVVIAIIDSGFDLEHEDLRTRFLPGYDFCNVETGLCSSTSTPTDNNPGFSRPQNTHGTHVAGIAGAAANNSAGISGVAPQGSIRLLPVKIFNNSGTGATFRTLIDAMRWSAGLEVRTTDNKTIRNPHPARILNLSVGVDQTSQEVERTITELRNQGVLILAATGNTGANRVLFPASSPGVMAVGSHSQSFTRSCFSNYGVGVNGPGGVDILAAGGEANPRTGVPCEATHEENIVSTIPRNVRGEVYETKVGTSMATPVVAGVAALVLSHYPEMSVEDLEARLLGTAYFDPSYMTPEAYGAGILRADRALGLPGPGDPVAVQAIRVGGAANRSAVTVLDPYGGSSPYTFTALGVGDYRLQAGTPLGGTLYGEKVVQVVREDQEVGPPEADLRLQVR